MIVKHNLMVPLYYIIMVHKSLSQFTHLVAVFLCVFLQINHILLKSLDQTRILLLAKTRRPCCVSGRVSWLKSLRHNRHTFLLHKLLDLGYLLCD